MTTPRVLMVPYGHSLAHVTRLLEIGRVLRAGGASVVFAGEGRYFNLIQQAGFPIQPLLELSQSVVTSHANRASLGFHSRKSVAAFVQAELDLYRQLGPDIVVGDFRPTARISTRLASLPYAVVVNAMYTPYYSAWRRAPQTHPLTRIIPGKLIYCLLPLVPLINRCYCRPYNQVLRRHGQPPISRIEQLFTGDLTLMADIPEYGPTRNRPPSFHYVGPITWEPDCPPPSWLDALDRDRATIYFTLGSTGSRRVFEIATAAFAGTDFQVLLTTGRQSAAESAGPWPANFRVADLAPGRQLMAASHLLVFHGGNGTAYQALQNGLPMIGIPANLDQEWNVDRLVDIGVAEKIVLTKCSGPALLATARQVLGDPSYRDKAHGLQDILRRYHGPETAARLIAEFAE